MGGSAFATCTPPLPTPRMPRETFDLVLATTQATLGEHFSLVAAPIEGPGKETFGDVDIHVFGPLDPKFNEKHVSKDTVAQNIADSLSARKWIQQRNSPEINLAIPWPQQSEDEETKYVQVDVKICHSEKAFGWEVFHGTHGDLWNILGTMIHQFGITVNNMGMFVRIPEIEPFDRKKSMILLTDQPAQILEFLGLEQTRWWRQFTSQQEMFEYAATCRMFWVKEAKAEDETMGDVHGDLTIEGQEGGEAGVKKLRHGDRQRMAKRPIFRAWIEEFIPSCRQEGKFGNANVTREGIREAAFEMFEVKDEYETRLSEWQLVKNKDDVWKAIKEAVPTDVDPPLRAAAMRTLKAAILEAQEFDGLITPVTKINGGDLHSIAEVQRYVESNWAQAGEIGWARQQAKAKENMKLKAQQRLQQQKLAETQVQERN